METPAHYRSNILRFNSNALHKSKLWEIILLNCINNVIIFDIVIIDIMV